MLLRAHIVKAVAATILLATVSHAQDREQSERVSLIQLISNPDRYEGKLVHIDGFVHINFEDNAIWLHKDDFDNSINSNSLWINVNRCVGWDGKPMSGYASVLGRFSSQHRGHMGLWPGVINQVGECFPLPQRRSGT
ncbi:MAG: hypothetical protein QM769_13060 [Pseudoxanthomonas sp.]